jgi:prephenate dehydrogenase
MSLRSIKSVGVLGFGAFGRFITNHLSAVIPIVVHDPAITAISDVAAPGVRFGSAAEAGSCDLLIIAVPVSHFSSAIQEARPHLRPGAIVVDVGSVKVKPIRVMQALLPEFVEIVGTHPLFGPQSARAGIAGRKIVICPVRGHNTARRLAALLRRRFRLQVIVTTPEDHDRQVAMVQGITHLIARVLVRMEPWPNRMTTASFDHLVQATEMVRHDPEGVFTAIERETRSLLKYGSDSSLSRLNCERNSNAMTDLHFAVNRDP